MDPQPRNRELWLAFLTILAITAVYLYVVMRTGAVPAASEVFGHSLGIVGFLLMLMTETLYSIRKRTRRARWGKMSSWLQFHIYTGLVGSYMVLLHSSWKFQGLAGVVMLLTVVIVVSGFIGRYIYTAIPRTAEGAEIEARALEEAIARTEAQLQQWMASQPRAAQALAQRLAALPEVPKNQLLLVWGRTFLEWGYRLQWWYEKRKMNAEARAQAAQLEKLLARRRRLQRQMASLATARRLMAAWHSVHIPIGMALFTAAFIHIGAALYYATLLH